MPQPLLSEFPAHYTLLMKLNALAAMIDLLKDVKLFFLLVPQAGLVPDSILVVREMGGATQFHVLINTAYYYDCCK